MADCVDFIGIDQAPKVVLAVAAIESQTQTRTENADDGGNAGGGDIARVEGFEFHTDFEVVRWRIGGLFEAFCGRCFTPRFL